MAGVGALPAGMFSDKFGRKKVIISSSIIYGVGALLCAVAFSKWVLLIGRIFIGLGLGKNNKRSGQKYEQKFKFSGLSSMIVPVYVSEASPVHIRGKLLTTYQLLLGIGIVAGNIIGGCFSYVDPEKVGWRFVN
jgi:MFS transporter, SP family, solute carrier family 2 (myo-inositol transporter), member 13